MTDITDFTVLTEPARLGWCSLFKATVSKMAAAGTKPKFSAQLLLPPNASQTVQAIKDAVKGVAIAKWGQKLPQFGPHGLPLHKYDGKYETIDDSWMTVRAASQYQPGVVDQKVKPILDQKRYEVDPEGAIKAAEARIFAGCWVRAHLSFYTWDNAFGKGVGCNLNHIQLIREDSRLGGGRYAASDLFEPVAGEEPEAKKNDPFNDVLG